MILLSALLEIFLELLLEDEADDESEADDKEDEDDEDEEGDGDATWEQSLHDHALPDDATFRCTIIFLHTEQDLRKDSVI